MGGIRHHHFGEGEYPQTEMVIQRLLMDAGADDLDLELVAVEPRGLEVAADWHSLRSPETYLGYLQSSGFAAEGTTPRDLPHEFSAARACRSTPGTSRETGRWLGTRSPRTHPARGSPSNSTPAMSIS